MRARWWVGIAIVAAACGEHGSHDGEHGHDGEQGHAGLDRQIAPALAPGGSPVRAEMRLLDEAMQAAAHQFAESDLRPIAERLHAVHAARERTEAAIASGSYRPPRGGDRMERFAELDDRLHASLEELAHAAIENERDAAAAAMGRALAQCEGCHSEFRR